MRLTSNFNNLKVLTQTSRHENMAYKEGTKPSINDVQKEQVEVITDINEYTGGSKNVISLIKNILAGKGRVVVAPNIITEDGGIIPLGKTPAKEIKNLSPIMNYQSDVNNIGDLQIIQAGRIDEKIESEISESIDKTHLELLNLHEKSQKKVTEPISSTKSPVVEPKIITEGSDYAVEQYVKQVQVGLNGPPPAIEAKQEGNTIDLKV